MENKIQFCSNNAMTAYVSHHFSYLGSVKNVKQYTGSYSVMQFYDFKAGYMSELHLHFKVIKEGESIYWMIEKITL